jgi:hypothetical protein
LQADSAPAAMLAIAKQMTTDVVTIVRLTIK